MYKFENIIFSTRFPISSHSNHFNIHFFFWTDRFPLNSHGTYSPMLRVCIAHVAYIACFHECDTVTGAVNRFTFHSFIQILVVLSTLSPRSCKRILIFCQSKIDPFFSRDWPSTSTHLGKYASTSLVRRSRPVRLSHNHQIPQTLDIFCLHLEMSMRLG